MGAFTDPIQSTASPFNWTISWNSKEGNYFLITTDEDGNAVRYISDNLNLVILDPRLFTVTGANGDEKIKANVAKRGDYEILHVYGTTSYGNSFNKREIAVGKWSDIKEEVKRDSGRWTANVAVYLRSGKLAKLDQNNVPGPAETFEFPKNELAIGQLRLHGGASINWFSGVKEGTGERSESNTDGAYVKCKGYKEEHNAKWKQTYKYPVTEATMLSASDEKGKKVIDEMMPMFKLIQDWLEGHWARVSNRDMSNVAVENFSQNNVQAPVQTTEEPELEVDEEELPF